MFFLNFTTQTNGNMSDKSGKNKVAAFLIRCSTDKQDFERQEQDLRAVADRYYFDIYPETFGEHITGKDDTTKMDRLSIVRCRTAAEEHKFDVLLVSEVSRMSRDSVSGRVYVRQFCNAGIPIYFRDKMKWTIDPETGKQDESFIKELGLYFDGAAEYLKSMKTQIASGRRASLRNNQLVVGHLPIGYKKLGGKDKRTKNTIIIDEDVAPMVRDVFTMYQEEGATMKTVALAITAKYNIRKTVSGIQQILARKEYYTGEYTIYMNDPDNQDKEPEPFTLTFEPLIDKETYDAVERKRSRQVNCREPYPKQQIRPLTKLIKCPYCGYSFSCRKRAGDTNGEKYRIINGKIAISWMCTSRMNNQKDCRSHVNLNGEKTEAILWSFIKRELLGYADLNKDIRAEKIYQLEQRISDAEKQIPLYEQEIAKAESRVKRAYNGYIVAPDGMEDTALELYNNAMLDLKKTKEAYTDEINRLKDIIKSCQTSIEYYNKSNISSDYIANIEDNDTEKRKLFVQLIEKVVPYGITPGVFVLELHAINGDYIILFNANNVGRKRIAYYIDAPFVVWCPDMDNTINSYFRLKNLDILDGADIIDDPSHVSFNELIQLCEANAGVIPYYYIYERTNGK